MSANSRRKGATFERDIAKRLFAETGITFKRDLEQYRAGEHGDLIPDDDAWPFLIECKNIKAAKTFRAAWAEQVNAAIKDTGKFPCVIYKIGHGDIRVRVWFDSIAAVWGGSATTHQHADISIEGLAYLAREIMAK